jgi:hypothetical protein
MATLTLLESGETGRQIEGDALAGGEDRRAIRDEERGRTMVDSSELFRGVSGETQRAAPHDAGRFM